MSLELYKATSPSNSAFRVVCGKMAVNGNQNVHQEAIFGRLKSGDVTLEVSGAVMSLNLNDIFFIAPNNKYKLSGSADAVVNVVSLNFTNPAKMYEMFYELFANDYVKITDAETKSKKYRALMRVTNYIDEHYSDGVSLEEVALATGISRYYVSHLFKELMNTTFVGYVNELRLNRAAMLLVTTDSPIIEIASLSGFNNLSNFNRAFKMYFDRTPSAYRKA